jgi:hypothetical protein
MSEDMTAPVTRGELKEELAELRTEVRAEFRAVRAESREELAKFRVEFRAEINEDLARHMNAGFEMMRQSFAILADQDKAQTDRHASLARRVDVLEVAVFDPPKP